MTTGPRDPDARVGPARTGVCIVRVTSAAGGDALIEVSTTPDVESPANARRQSFGRDDIRDALRVVSHFVTSRVAPAEDDATTRGGEQ